MSVSDLEESYEWPQRLKALSVLSADAVAALDRSILDPMIGGGAPGSSGQGSSSRPQ